MTTQTDQPWLSKEKDALELIGIAGRLWLEDSIELIIFRRNIVDARASEILNNHEYARHYVNKPLTVTLSLEISKVIASLGLAPSRIDIGVLAKEYLTEGEGKISLGEFLKNKLQGFIGKDKKVLQPVDVVLYGFGRIGRLAAREIVRQTGKESSSDSGL